MKRIALRFLAFVSISFFLMSCATPRVSDRENSPDYYTSHTLKPGLSTTEIQDLLNSPNQLYSGNDEFGRNWSIWYFDQKALPSTSPRIPTNLVLSFDFGNVRDQPVTSKNRVDGLLSDSK